MSWNKFLAWIQSFGSDSGWPVRVGSKIISGRVGSGWSVFGSVRVTGRFGSTRNHSGRVGSEKLRVSSGYGLNGLKNIRVGSVRVGKKSGRVGSDFGSTRPDVKPYSVAFVYLSITVSWCKPRENGKNTNKQWSLLMYLYRQ